MASDIQYDGKIITVAPLPLVSQKGVGQLFFDFMQKHKDAVAQIDGMTGEKDTYGSMLERCIRTAVTMRSKGVTSEDIISVCTFNHLDSCVPILASIFLGVKFAPIDPSFDVESTIHFLKQIKPKMIFVSLNAVKLMEETLRVTGSQTKIVVFGDTITHTPYKDFLVESPLEKNFKPKEISDLKETFAIFFSSGTTGSPKGICWSHKIVLGQISLIWDSKDKMKGVILTYSTLSWISSYYIFMLAIITGSARVVLPSFDTKSLWTCIEKYKVNMLRLTPNQIAIIQSEKPSETNTSSLKLITTGGAAVDKEQANSIKKLLPGALLSVSYGLTEGGNLGFRLTSNPEDLQLMLQNPQSCGRPLPGYSYKIVDPITEETLGANQKGELRIKSEYQMNGYYNLDSSSAWDSEGYLKTGDIAYYDEKFCFFIVDRIKEIFKVRQCPVSPSKLEGILRTHPAVENSVVFGLPHPTDSFHPAAVVTLKPAANATPEDIQNFLSSRVTEPEQLIGGVKIVESIPETPSGKFKRNYTRDLFIQNRL